ncbi:hypothetical protein D3C72_2256570 [compost metagenome]
MRLKGGSPASATTTLLSFAVGTSSTICTLRVLLVVSLSLSTNVTVKSSNRLLLPLAVGCVSLSSRL